MRYSIEWSSTSIVSGAPVGRLCNVRRWLKIDAISGGNPWWNRADAAQMGFEGELALGGPGDARHIEQGCLAIERPYEAPGLGRRIGENPGARRDLVACRNVNADAGVVEPPVMIGA